MGWGCTARACVCLELGDVDQSHRTSHFCTLSVHVDNNTSTTTFIGDLLLRAYP